MKGLALLTVLAMAATLPTAALAQNVLSNPGFENGPTGGGASAWVTFGNVFTEAANPPQFEPYEGNQLVSMFGNWTGGFNVTGMFQEFPTYPGAEWNLSCKTRHWSSDALAGAAGDGNWVVQKIVFKDAADVELPGAVESIVLDGTFATDVWHDNATITGVAPMGTVQIEAFVLYLQPLYDGGAAQVDNVVLTQTPLPVSVDVHPGSCPNPVNLNMKGVVPVAVLGSAGFDVSSIDMGSLQLAGVPAKRATVMDVAAPYMGDECGCTTAGPDGFDDLALKFLAADLVEALLPASYKEERTLTLTGSLMDGTPIAGTDCVIIVGTPKDMIAGTPDGEPDDQGGNAATGPLGLTVREEGPVHRIDYVLPEPAQVTLTVFDVSGRLVDRLVQSYEAAGSHTVAWNGASRPGGVYFYRLRAGDQWVTRKVLLVNR